jgi:hypothetical protein
MKLWISSVPGVDNKQRPSYVAQGIVLYLIKSQRLGLHFNLADDESPFAVITLGD